MGGAVALLCGAAIRYDHWFIVNTGKGRRLAEAFGEARAVWIWRILLLAGIAFGVLLATGHINPLRWNESSRAAPVAS